MHNVYSHRWSAGDIVVWNNRRVLHRVTQYAVATERRRLWRAEAIAEPPIAFLGSDEMDGDDKKAAERALGWQAGFRSTFGATC